MSTRGRIAIKRKDGSYLSVYHHSDSYPEYLGKLLINHYNDEQKLLDAIMLGDSSAWNETIEENVYYGRDCGEQNTQPLVSLTIQDLLDDGTSSWEQYVYVRENAEWTMFDSNRRKHNLTQYIAKNFV